MVDRVLNPGRLQAAPENFLSDEQVKAVAAGRRDFLRKSFVAAGAALVAPMVARASEVDHNTWFTGGDQSLRQAFQI
jgi:sulfane dehydrogenase subunit SoxC